MAKYRSKGEYVKVADLSMGYAVDKVTLWRKATAPDVAGLLRQKAAAPIKPRKPQQPCDVGLFSDDADQLDLVSWLTEQTEE